MKFTSGTWLNLPSLGLSVRVLFTGYILAVGFGLLMAGIQIMAPRSGKMWARNS